MNSQQVLAHFEKRKRTHLLASIALDVLGMASYGIPFFAELTDLIFAPIYGLLIFIMYRRRTLSGLAGGIVGTIEEWFPGTDVMPTATIMWIYTYIFTRNKTLRKFVEEREEKLDLIEEELKS